VNCIDIKRIVYREKSEKVQARGLSAIPLAIETEAGERMRETRRVTATGESEKPCKAEHSQRTYDLT